MIFKLSIQEKHMRRFPSFTVALAGFALAFGIAGTFAFAQDKAAATAKQTAGAAKAGGPVAVVSITNLERLLSDTSYLLQASSVPEVGGFVSVMATQYTQGMDRARPLGLMVSLEDGNPVFVGFLPIADRGAFFDALAGIGVEPDDLGDGLFEIAAGGNAIFVKDANGWLYISQTEEALDNVPVDPSTALGELPKKYDVAVKINMQALPADIVDMMTEQIRGGFERSMAEQADQSPEEAEKARELGEASMAQLEQSIRDTEQVVLGWAIDEKGQKTYFDGGAQFVGGSKLAVQMDEAKNLKTAFSAFKLPEAVVSFRSTSLVSESDKGMIKNSLNTSLEQVKDRIENEINDDKASETVLELIDKIAKLFEQTIDEGMLDGSLSASVSGDALKVLVGGRVADGKALAQAVQDAVKDLSSYPEVPKFEFGYETYGGMTLHRTSIPVDSNDRAVQKVFGNSIKLTIGTADKAFALSLDASGDASLKSAIDAMKKTPSAAATPFEGVIEVADILEYAQSVAPNSMLDIVVEAVKLADGKDKVLVNGNVIPRGVIYRLSLDEGVLRAAGAAAKAGQPNAGGF